MDDKYYIHMQSREISKTPYGNSNYLTIHATEKDIEQLRSIMDNITDADNMSFIRSHVPIVPYHKDSANDDYDEQFSKALKMIYDLGTDETKQHIESMGVLQE
ncbi:MAG TPA: hydrolase [Bacillota bacterium]|nr:hydrolase [Bacillota bacterium]